MVVQELFETVGPVKSVQIKDTGVASVIFQKRSDALKAHAEYNQVKLDGMLHFENLTC